MDIDGTITECNDIYNAFIDFYDLKPHSSWSYNMEQTHQLTRSDWVRFYDERIEEVYKNARPRPLAKEVMTMLSYRKYFIALITARESKHEEITQQWLEANSIPHDTLFFSDNKELVCSNMGIDLIIEDNPHHALVCAEANIPVYIMDTPYNQGISHNLITRVNGWGGVKVGIDNG